jgi:hypothetical protein
MIGCQRFDVVMSEMQTLMSLLMTITVGHRRRQRGFVQRSIGIGSAQDWDHELKLKQITLFECEFPEAVLRIRHLGSKHGTQPFIGQRQRSSRLQYDEPRLVVSSSVPSSKFWIRLPSLGPPGVLGRPH